MGYVFSIRNIHNSDVMEAISILVLAASEDSDIHWCAREDRKSDGKSEENEVDELMSQADVVSALWVFG